MWCNRWRPSRTLAALVGSPQHNVITAALPDLEAILDALPDDLGVPPDELRARTRLAYLQSHVSADADELDAAIDVLRKRAAGDAAADPFGPRVIAETFDALVESADRSLAAGPLDLATVLALQFESGAIAARHGQRLILFLGVNAEVRRLAWSMAVDNLRRARRRRRRVRRARSMDAPLDARCRHSPSARAIARPSAS